MKVIISGASSGVGLKLAEMLSDKHNVVGLGRRGKIASNFEYHSIDYTKDFNFDLAPRQIDSIVYCSAQFKSARLVDHTEKDILDMVSVNLTGAILFVRKYIPYMKKDGRIILVSSVAGLRGQHLQTVYSATKHGLEGFADSLRMEVSQQVTTLSPGGINTPLWNAENPYDGNVDDLLTTEDVANWINYVMNSDHPVKNITIYPKNESH